MELVQSLENDIAEHLGKTKTRRLADVGTCRIVFTVIAFVVILSIAKSIISTVVNFLICYFKPADEKATANKHPAERKASIGRNEISWEDVKNNRTRQPEQGGILDLLGPCRTISTRQRNHQMMTALYQSMCSH